MLFDAGNPILKVIGVEHMLWKSGTFNVAPRAYSALAFRISGSAVIKSGEKECTVNSNGILYIPQGVGYVADYTDTELLVIHFVTALGDSNAEVYSFQNSDKIYKLFLNAHSTWQNKMAGFAAYTMSLLYLIIGTMLEKDTEVTLPPNFLNAVSLLNADYKSSELNIENVCARSNISATAFRQIFKKNYQKTPMEYVTELRIEHARNLIAGGMSVEEAAYDSGFNDSKYFARVVKKHFGCTPRSFKDYGK